jgi:hypothetical protein
MQLGASHPATTGSKGAVPFPSVQSQEPPLQKLKNCVIHGDALLSSKQNSGKNHLPYSDTLYPPLEQRCFPFPFPWGSIGRETGNGSLS